MTREVTSTQARAIVNEDLRRPELTLDELCLAVGGMRKSAGGSASGVMFLAFTFKLT